MAFQQEIRYSSNMSTPHVTFSYDTEKDIENIVIGLKTVRKGRKPDSELAQILEEYGEELSREDIESYLRKCWDGKEHIRELIVDQLQTYWDSIEKKFFLHLADRMQLDSFYGIKKINGFLSTRYGAGYDVDNAWFAVSAHNGTLRNTLTAMHESMHIFFHKQWWEVCSQQNVPDKNIWDIKEATTVLLNLWFKNQLVDLDMGYNEHIGLRKKIKRWFLNSRDFEDVIQKACEYMKEHPQESAKWAWWE